jgi:hypothetical protein
VAEDEEREDSESLRIGEQRSGDEDDADRLRGDLEANPEDPWAQRGGDEDDSDRLREELDRQ